MDSIKVFFIAIIVFALSVVITAFFLKSTLDIRNAINTNTNDNNKVSENSDNSSLQKDLEFQDNNIKSEHK
jgi:cell division protein FtsL